jgi:hypothetical protein
VRFAGGASLRAVGSVRRVQHARGRVLSDRYRIARDDHGVVSCVRTQVRELRLIPVHGSQGFECGLAAGAGGEDLALTILADFLEASTAVRAYAMPLGPEVGVWELHLRFCARWLSPLHLSAGEFVDLDSSLLEDWLIAEALSLPNRE